MAIQTDLQESQYGVPFVGAYFRIATASVSRTRNADQRFMVMLDVIGYATRPTHDDVREVAFHRLYAPLTELEAQQGENFLTKCYAWVMAQPDFATSIAT
jgi:hypothetical protein